MPHLIGATTGHGCEVAMSGDQRQAAVVWVGSGHRDEVLEHHVSSRVIACMGRSRDDLLDADAISSEVRLVLRDTGRTKVAFCCAAIDLTAKDLTARIVGTRFGIYRRGEWLLSQPRSLEKPHLRGFEGAAIENDVAFPTVTFTIRIPIGEAVGASLTDAANFRGAAAEVLLARIAQEKVENSEQLTAMLADVVGNQGAAIVTVSV